MTNSFHSRLFYSLVGGNLADLEHELLEIKSVEFLADYFWPAGKRIRPIIFLLSNLSVRVDKSRQVILGRREKRLAAAIELLHEASLVHDDIVDRSPVRRGQPTMHMANGDGLALLIGDYMVFRGLKLILDAAESAQDVRLAQDLADTGLHIASGQVQQLYRYLKPQKPQDRMSWDSYLQIIAGKTAYFFAGCANAGAALAGADRDLRKVYREFGMNLGLVFQMVDDLMDTLGDATKARKTLRKNVSEGTITLPMVHAYSMYPTSAIVQRLSRGQPLGQKYESALYRLLGSKKVIDRCKDTVEMYVKRAADQLRHMPSSIYRLGLADLLDYVSCCPWGGLEAKLSRNAAESKQPQHRIRGRH